MQGTDNGVTAAGWRQAISVAAARVRADIAFAAIDVFIVTSAYVVGLGLRMLDPTVGEGYWMSLALALPIVVFLHIGANALAGAYGHVWEYASTSEAIRLVVANASASGVILLLELAARSTIGTFIPLSTLVLGGLLSFLLMGLVRYRSRLFSYQRVGDGPRILVVGSGPEAAVFARRAPEANNGGRVIGFIKTNGGGPSAEKLIADLPILGTVGDVADIVERERVDQVVIA